MPKYTVDFPLIYKKKKYMPDTTVTMSEELAAPLLKNGTLLVIEGQDPITEEGIVAAISQLDVMNATLWTGDGKPQVSALEAILKGNVSAAERNAGWKRYQMETE